MSDPAFIPQLERLVFYPGQPLTAGDLTMLESANKEMRWLHNRSLHSWGIGAGFEVTGQRGDSVVNIKPGYGIDSLGREIILTEPQTLPVPATAGANSYVLVAVYQPDEKQAVVERRPGVCLPGGAVRLSEEPLLMWEFQSSLTDTGQHLILAGISVRNCKLSDAVSWAGRRYARSSQQPFLAAGQTVFAQTAWQEWKIGNTVAGVSVLVDTSPAGFQTTPSYSAHITGERYLPGNPGVLLEPFVGIAEAGRDKFTLQALLPNLAQGPIPVNPPGALLANIMALNWQVVWMGIEG